MKWVTNEFCIHNWATFDPLGKYYCQLNMYELLKQFQFFPSTHLRSITFSKCQVNLNCSQILKANNIWRHYSIVLQKTRGLLNFFQYVVAQCLKIVTTETFFFFQFFVSSEFFNFVSFIFFTFFFFGFIWNIFFNNLTTFFSLLWALKLLKILCAE